MTTSPEVSEAEKARKKALHYRSMVWTGVWMMGCGVAAGYLAYSGAGDLPTWMYGRLRAAPAPAAAPERRAAPGVTAWRSWDAALLREAKNGDRLLLLDLRSVWSRACAVMEETTYADPEVAAWAARGVLSVRVDTDERPDLALRYLSGWPTTALLLPTGEVLDSAAALETGQFLPWGRRLHEAFRHKRAAVMDAAGRAAEDRRKNPLAAQGAPRETAAAAAGLWKGPPFFPRFESSAYLGKRDAPWAPLEDPVWGGFHRYAAGPGWTKVEREKLLSDQAGAVLAGAQPRRTLAYVAAFLSDPKGGYYASQAPEVRLPGGRVIEGAHYFGLPDAERRAFGLPGVDKRLFVGENALMARAVLTSSEAGPADKEQACRTMARLEREGLREGLALRRLGGSRGGLLQDQVRLAHLFVAVGRRDRAAALLLAARKALAEPGSPALYDRPALGELPEGLDQLAIPQLNAELLLVLREFGGAQARDWDAQLAAWLAPRAGQVDPALWLKLNVRHRTGTSPP